MLDVIFRHRARMAVVYGRIAPWPLAGERFRRAAVERRALRRPPKAPGEVGFRGRALVLRPMPARARRHGA
jgi:hypothetical protein